LDSNGIVFFADSGAAEAGAEVGAEAGAGAGAGVVGDDICIFYTPVA
jgi:hypothetical protein